MRNDPAAWHRVLAGDRDPGEPRPTFEAIVESVLSRGSPRKHVDQALATLRTFGLLDAAKLHSLDEGTIVEAIRPVGQAVAKARRLRGVLDWFVGRHGGDVEKLKSRSPDRLREELVEIKGLGAETADSILLHALGIPSFPIDLHAYRIMSRHGAVPESADYDEMRSWIQRGLPRDAGSYAALRARLTEVGKKHCRSTAKCAGCPLEPFPHA